MQFIRMNKSDRTHYLLIVLKLVALALFMLCFYQAFKISNGPY